MDQQPSEQPAKSKWLTRKEYTTDSEKRNDFWIGVVLFFVINIALTACQWGLGFGWIAVVPDFSSSNEISSSLSSILWIMLTLLPWVINIGLVIYFALTRSQIALGMVAGFGIALVIVICLGVIFTAWCFYALGSY